MDSKSLWFCRRYGFFALSPFLLSFLGVQKISHYNDGRSC